MLASFLLFSGLCARAIYLLASNMPYSGLRTPVVIFFLSLVVYPTTSLAALFVNPNLEILLSFLEKLFLGMTLFAFFYYMREIVFFESLFKTGYQNNAPVFTDDSNDEAVSR